MSLVPWKMVSAAWLCVLMVSLTTALDTSDDISLGDLTDILQAPDYKDSELLSVTRLRDKPALRSVLLHLLLASIRNEDVWANNLTGPKWIPSEGLVAADNFDLSTLKENNVKRTSEGILPKARAVVKQPTPKWKIKKGKVGSQMICYFKLCAFRPPN